MEDKERKVMEDKHKIHQRTRSQEGMVTFSCEVATTSMTTRTTAASKNSSHTAIPLMTTVPRSELIIYYEKKEISVLTQKIKSGILMI